MTTQPNATGTIRVIEQTEDIEERQTAGFEGVITIDLSRGEEPLIAASVDPEVEPQVAVHSRPDEGDATRAASDGGHRTLSTNTDGEEFVADHAYLPLVGSVTVLLGTLLAAVFGPSMWAVENSMLEPFVVQLAHLWTFGAGLAGTLWIWNDAEKLEGCAAAWQPDPRRYVGAGGLCIAVLGTAFFATQGAPATGLAPAFFGLLIAGFPMSALVVGPVYLLNRFRALGTLGEYPR